MARIGRGAYADMYGPTVGDRVRLADTELFAAVERDLTIYGEEVKFGGGKVIRDGMGQSQASQAEGAVDTVITNALIIDHWGIVKADVALLNGRIHKIGKAGNPDVQPGVDIIIGAGDGDHRGGRQDPDRGGDRRAYPLHLSAAGRGGAGGRDDDAGGRRDRAGDGDVGDDVYAGTLVYAADAAGGGGAAGQSGLLGERQCEPAGGAGGDAARGGVVPEAA